VRCIILLDFSSLAIQQYDAMSLRSPINTYEKPILLIQSTIPFLPAAAMRFTKPVQVLTLMAQLPAGCLHRTELPRRMSFPGT